MQYEYIDYINTGSKLFLGIEVSTKYEETYQFEKEPIKFSHQSAGLACEQHNYIGFFLNPTEKIEKLMNFLNTWGYESNIGAFGKTLNEIIEYRKILNDYLVDCNESYEFYEESIYPIDFDSNNFNDITKDDIPYDLDDLLIFNNPLLRMKGCFNRWKLLILTENSD